MVKRITMQEWKKVHRDYKTTINGVRHMLVLGEKGTTLVPVEIVK